MATLKKIMVWLIVLIILGGAGYGGYLYWKGRQAVMAQMMAAGGMGAMGGGPLPAPAAKCILQDITDSLDFTGTTEAVNAVEIRARVEGYLKGIHFADGSLVEEGQLLFTIEPETYMSRRDEAAAMLKAGRTELERARLDLERIEKAVQTGSVSQQELTRARAAYDIAQAQVMGYEAMLQKAELDLSYTEIRSPISGRIGRRLVDAGNLVGSGDRTVLTTVMQTQPIYVFFHIGEHLLKGDFLRQLQGGAGVEPLRFVVGLPDQNDYRYEGVVNYLDNTVDPRMGTVYVRGQLPNAGLELLPGMFVRVRVPVAERKNAVLVPEKAISTDLGGKYLLVVGKGNVLERRDVVLGATMGTLRVVTEGLDGSEMFVVGGFAMLRPGVPVTPMTGDGPPPGMMSGAGGPPEAMPGQE
jgi:RND family efflux transporter MFP subunit